MSGWTYNVTISKVKRKTKTIQVRAYSQDEAIELAKARADSMAWEAATEGLEYDARELT